MTNSIYHKAAITCLIKSRANQLLKELPNVDKLTYQKCIKKAKTLGALARCIIPLYDLKKQLIKDGKININNYMDRPLIRKKDGKKDVSRDVMYHKPLNNLTITNYGKSFDSQNVSVLITRNSQITHYPKKIINKKKFQIIRRTGKFLGKKYHNKNKKQSNRRRNVKFFRKHQIRQKRHVNSTNLFDAEVNLKIIMEKRRIEEKEEKIGSLPLNLKNLKRLERYTKMAKNVKTYIEEVKKHNEETLTQFDSPLFYRPSDEYSPTTTNDIFTLLEKLTTTLEDILIKNYKMSFFSPNLFNIFPSCSQEPCKQKRKLFSPTLFSFYKNDGYLSLPNILKSIMFNDEEENKWLNFIFDVTGAGKTLNKAMDLLAPMIDEMENKIYPAFEAFSKMESQYRRMSEMYDGKQLEEIKNNGYTFLYEDQLQVIYNNSKSDKTNFSIDKIKNMTRLELEERIEKDIRQIALIDDSNKNGNYIKRYEEIVQINREKRPWFRKKREIGIGKRRKKIRPRTTTNRPRRTTTEEDPAAEEAEEFEIFNTLQPFAFFNRIKEPVILEIQTLSPHAFVNELFSPEIIVATTLSPRAFIATILTPNILVARILQPAAFRMEVLSPRILTAWVLSPEFLLLEILSPHIIDPKVLSPEYLKIVVLSPTLASPRVLSQEGLAVLVLSPNILSPNLYSRESLVVEVLSPHFLGGQEHTESGESAEGEADGEHREGHKEGHGHHSEFHPIHIHTYPFTHLQIPHTIHVGD